MGTFSDEVTDAVHDWVTAWRETFDQNLSEEELKSYLGKNVHAERDTPEGKRGFDALVIGYSIDKVGTVDPAFRFSFMSAEGLQLSIFAGMEIRVVEEVA